MRNLCNSIIHLMSKYASHIQPQQEHQEQQEQPPTSPLSLMPPTRCSSDEEDRLQSKVESRSPSPRLFGVAIGIKRGRDGVEEEGAVEVKTEPSDSTAGDDGIQRWRLRRGCRSNQGISN